MRCQAYGVVVLLRTKPEWPGANFFENSHEGGDPGVLLGGRFPDQSVGVALEQFGVCVSYTRELLACHGVAAQKKGAAVGLKKVHSSLGDANFGAASIGDQRVGRGVARDL